MQDNTPLIAQLFFHDGNRARHISGRIAKLTRHRAVVDIVGDPPNVQMVLMLIDADYRAIKDLIGPEAPKQGTTLKVKADIVSAENSAEITRLLLNFRRHLSVTGPESATASIKEVPTE